MKNPFELLEYALAVGLIASCAGGATRADNIDPAADGSQYAYAENVGWLNAQPAGPGGPGIQVDDLELTGWMWGENIGWISLSCENTSSCATTSYGVANDGDGNLSGYAWGENAGWINMAPMTAGVTISPFTGSFSGRAWGENVGWITFASSGPSPYKVQTNWCLGTPAPPYGAPALALDKSGSDTVLSWTALPAAGWYDVVRGDLTLLRSSNGDFTSATLQCLSNNSVATSVSNSALPAIGNGVWFLVRGANCKGRGTYDSGVPSQVASRDAEINASPSSCP